MLDGGETRKRDARLEVARDKVWGCRDVVGVGDVNESMCEGVFLRVVESACCVSDTGEEERG